MMKVSKVAVGARVCLGLLLASCGGDSDRADIATSAATNSTEPTTTMVPTTTSSATTIASPTTLGRTTATTAAVTTTRRPTTTRPTTTIGATGGTRCSAAQLTVEVTTDRATYRPGEPVRVLATLRNRSAAPCLYNSYTGSHRFEGPSGQVVRPGPVFIADAFAETPLAAGATLTQNPTWDQQACPSGNAACSQAPPGTYTVKVGWGFDGPPIEGSATFRLVAA